jgi:Fur family peroxide stress response transcriptional regulator
MKKENIIQRLKEKGLKATSQRIAVLQAVLSLNHPTIEQIIGHLKDEHPTIATGTVYKILDAFVDNGIIKRVKTDNDHMRFDGIMQLHHHLYSKDSNQIEDYFDDELNDILTKYFAERNIPNFDIDSIRVNLIGKFKK